MMKISLQLSMNFEKVYVERLTAKEIWFSESEEDKDGKLLRIEFLQPRLIHRISKSKSPRFCSLFFVPLRGP